MFKGPGMKLRLALAAALIVGTTVTSATALSKFPSNRKGRRAAAAKKRKFK